MWTWPLLVGAELQGSTLGLRFGMIWDTLGQRGLGESATGGRCLFLIWNGLSPSLPLPLKEMALPGCACGLGLERVLSARNSLVGNFRGGGRGDFLLYRLGN